MKIFGIALIVIGALVMIYQGFTYTKTSQVAQIGSLDIKADSQKTIPISPIVGGVCLVAGTLILVMGRNRSS